MDSVGEETASWAAAGIHMQSSEASARQLTSWTSAEAEPENIRSLAATEWQVLQKDCYIN